MGVIDEKRVIFNLLVPVEILTMELGPHDALALEFYLWNIGLAQAVLKDVLFFEVALRIAYDRVISIVWNGSNRWLFDNASRRDTNNRIVQINNVRNRAAHHEHLFVPYGEICPALKACEDAVKLFSQLAPEACSYIYGNDCRICSAREFVSSNPAPCSVAV